MLPLVLSAVLSASAFTAGETLRFEVEFLGLTAGEFTLAVERDESGGLRLKSAGRTLGSADSMFRIRSESWCVVDEGTLLPQKCRAAWSSRTRDRRREVRYDRDAGVIHERILDAGEAEQNEIKLEGNVSEVHEMLSGMYLSRRAPPDPEKPLVFRGYRADKSMKVETRFVKKERVTTRAGTFDAIVVRVRVVEKLEQDHADGALVWLTDDERRLPVLMESEAPVGKMVVHLVSATGTAGADVVARAPAP